ncbi:MAG: Eco57I restriction-modification methylase domain-containing protein, partial [Verrucomicrobiales bacterium]|nr:Eco57I restriction-modification methylase domain-containing protein [Verrucomicrobiales bacterium]
PQAVELAKLNLWLRYIEINRDAFLEQLRVGRARRRPLNLLPELTRNLKRGNSLIADPAVAGDAAFDWPKEFPEIMERGGFDVVLGNPPYERIQTLQAHAPQVVECLKKTYRAAASGNFDIYVCFIERGLQMLGPQGLLGFICPNKFFQAEYGRPLRTLLTEGRHVRQILSFGHEQVFPQASTYTCLLFLQRQPHDQPVYVKVDDLDAWRQSGQAASGRIASIGFGPQPWNFVLANGAELFEKLNQFPVRLRDVAERIAQGIRTSANPVYVLELRRADAKKVVAFSEQLQREVTLERKAVAFFLQGQNIRRYFLEPCRQVVVFPYRIRKGHAELIPETVLRRQFPLTHAYLRENKKILEAREDGRMRGQRWYAYVYPKNIELMHTPKILVPDIANFASFAHDENGQFAFTAGYGITLKADAGPSPAYVLGLLNSRLLDFYLKQVSTSLRGGYFRYFSQFIEQLPLKLIDRNNKREARLERDIIERVEKIQLAHRQRAALFAAFDRLVAHRSRSPCNLACYLQGNFAAALKPEILIDDVQRSGFVHAIQIEADANGLLLSATVAGQRDAPPRPTPVLRLGCRNEPLRCFLFAAWKQFLTEHARLKKWSKGRHPDSVYRLLVNTLEPLVCFSSDADENLRAIHDLMSAVEREAGTADLAAVEAEIERLDREIDARVYELYGLTPDEIALVEGRQQSRFQP